MNLQRIPRKLKKLKKKQAQKYRTFEGQRPQKLIAYGIGKTGFFVAPKKEHALMTEVDKRPFGMTELEYETELAFQQRRIIETHGIDEVYIRSMQESTAHARQLMDEASGLPPKCLFNPGKS